VSRHPDPQRLLTLAAFMLVGVVALWAGVRLYQTRAAASPTARLKVPVGEASAPTPSDLMTDLGETVRMPARIPDRLPDFELADPAGTKTAIHHWAGRSLVLNFWATWCEPCRREIPLLESLSSRWADRGITVVGIAVDEPKAVSAFAREFSIHYPLLVGEDDALAVIARLGFESPGFPFTVFTDRAGDVVALFLGELHAPQAEMILGQVQAVDERHVPVAEARRTIRAELERLRSSG
jgi:peroxiredoxin